MQLIFFFIIITGLLLKWSFIPYEEIRNDRRWVKQIFPQGRRYSRDRFMEAHVCLAARMIQNDVKNAGKKVIYIHKYFRKKFPNSEYNFQEVLTDCYSHPFDEKTVVKWLNRHLKDRSKKVQIMYFLAGLSNVDGSINGKEMALLHSINELLGLTPKEFQSVIGMYQQRHERKSEPSPRARKTYIRLACEVIGVSENAKMDEIKKAYRKLVKIHHPDRFANESEEQQNIAEQKFLEIQKAYETLEKRK